MSIPPEYENVNPKSVVICIYPTGAPYYQGKPTIAITMVDTYNHSKFATVVKRGIPAKRANFDVPVEIQFEYVKGKYVYGSKWSWC